MRQPPGTTAACITARRRMTCGSPTRGNHRQSGPDRSCGPSRGEHHPLRAGWQCWEHADPHSGCVLAGQVGISDYLKMGNGVVSTTQSGVGHHVKDGARISRSPAFDNRKCLRSMTVLTRRYDLDRRVRILRKFAGRERIGGKEKSLLGGT